MKLKKLVALILALVTALSLVACGSGGNGSGGGDSTDGDASNFPKMPWSAATSGAAGANFDVGLEKFSELLQEKTGGAIKLDIYCSDQLTNGNQADSIQANIDGTIDVTFQADGVWGNFDTVFSVPNLPFLFDNYDDVDSKLINGEGGKYLMNAMDSKFNVKCLGIGENGFRYLTNSKHPVKTPEALHDLTLRIGGAEGQKPVGICGSGIIDVIAELYRTTIISSKGQFVRTGKRVAHDEHGMGRYILATAAESETGREISITEVDIDSFIRAKAAIFSAINIMLSSLDMDVSVLSHVYVAGGIGSGINMENAVRIGMLPDIDRELFEYLGNTSLSGAYAMARSDCAVDKVDELASNMTYMELSTNPRYMDEFVAACFLPHTNRELFPSSVQE